MKSSDWTFLLTKLDDISTLTTSMSPDLAASSSCFSISDPVEGGSSVKQLRQFKNNNSIQSVLLPVLQVSAF